MAVASGISPGRCDSPLRFVRGVEFGGHPLRVGELKTMRWMSWWRPRIPPCAFSEVPENQGTTKWMVYMFICFLMDDLVVPLFQETPHIGP